MTTLPPPMVPPRHEAFMKLALEEAERAAALGEIPVGAVLVCQGTVVARAHNTRETQYDPLGHAELTALREGSRRLGRWRLNGCTLYVTLEPCPMCAPALVQARVDRIVYGAMDPKLGAAGTVFNLVERPEFNHRPEVISGICEAEAQAVLKRFFHARRSGEIPGWPEEGGCT